MNEAEYLKSEETNIRNIAKKRIKEIISLIGYDRDYKVLDLGSNHGFYLDEYRHEGWHAWGIERGEEYKSDIATFKDDIRTFDYTKLQKIAGKFNIISAYCILEHLTHDELFELLPTLSSLLRRGGLLVVKAPYCKGLTGRFAPDKYYIDPNHKIELGKDDLWIEVLEKCYNMKLVKTVIEGIHPERVFPRIGKTWIANWLTEKLGMGDARVWNFKKF